MRQGKKKSERAYQMELEPLIKRQMYGTEWTGTLLFFLFVHLNDIVIIHNFNFYLIVYDVLYVSLFQKRYVYSLERYSFQINILNPQIIRHCLNVLSLYFISVFFPFK